MVSRRFFLPTHFALAVFAVVLLENSLHHNLLLLVDDDALSRHLEMSCGPVLLLVLVTATLWMASPLMDSVTCLETAMHLLPA